MEVMEWGSVLKKEKNVNGSGADFDKCLIINMFFDATVQVLTPTCHSNDACRCNEDKVVHSVSIHCKWFTVRPGYIIDV